MSFFSTTKPSTPVVSDYDKQWAHFSYERWRSHFERFMCDVDLSSNNVEQIRTLIRKASECSDIALEVEQERWSRDSMEGK